VELPVALFSVVFRPLPFEATNPQAFLASMEGVFLLVMIARNWRRLGHFIPRRRAPFITFVASYSLLFMVAFSNLSNFGILARQRTQLFPFLLVILAVPLSRRGGTPEPEPAEVTAPLLPAVRDRSRVAV
jgi:hypothetical protein